MVVEFRKQIVENKTSTHVIGGDSASRVARNELDLHVDLAEQILILGVKARARGLVERKSEKVSIVEYLSAAISPRNVKVLVEITGGSNNNERANK